MTQIAIRLNHGFTPSKLIEVEIQPKEFDPSITDPTFFTPVGSMVRKLNSQDKVSQQIPDLYYDFKDGRDTGMTIPISRKKGSDLAEIEREIKQVSDDVSKAITKESKRRKQEQSETQSTSSAPVQNGEAAE